MGLLWAPGLHHIDSTVLQAAAASAFMARARRCVIEGFLVLGATSALSEFAPALRLCANGLLNGIAWGLASTSCGLLRLFGSGLRGLH